MKNYKNFIRGCVMIVSLCIAQTISSQTIVSSLTQLLPYLDDDNVNIKLSPGTYTVNAANVASFGNPILLFEGSNSTYDFTDVTINFDTEIFKSFGSVDVKEIQILGNNNVLKNLTMVDDGSVYDNPSKTALGIAMDGANNRIEGFHMTVKGSWPYGYGDAFGKGGTNTVIYHYKHSSILVRGESNHVKDCTVIQRSYGHCIFMQAASNPIIEGCYLEGEVRTTDDMLAEEGTGTRADDVDFMTTWGYRLPAGHMMSLQEEGIRAYNGGETIIDGVAYSRGTSNPTVLNCTIKNFRGGVTLTHATGTKYVEGCTTIGCERGYAIGSGDIVNCKGDALYGPVLGFDYSNDRNVNADITLLPSNASYNGSKALAYIGGSNHNITLRDSEATVNQDLRVMLSGDNISVRHLEQEGSSQDFLTSSNIEINNLTNYPMVLASDCSDASGQSCGSITDLGTDNAISNSTSCTTITTNNLALNGIASQSSSRPNDGFAANAIDGNTNGIWSQGSVTHTLNETNAWWQVDLEGNYDIDTIVLFNRTDCCAGRLTNFTVSGIDSDGNTTFSQFYDTAPSPSIVVNAEGAKAKIIKIVLENGDNPLSLAEVEVYGEESIATTFIPDPNKVYYIDSAYHNVRLAATGESEDAYTTTTTTVGEDVEWKFVSKGNGYWHIDRAAGGSKPRLRTDNSEYADMQESNYTGTYTYYGIMEGFMENTYFLTLVDGPTNFNRLQVDNNKDVKMVTTSHEGTWESFRITEVVIDENIGNFRLIKRNASGFAIDGGSNANINDRSLELYTNVNHENLTWTEIKRGDYYSYEKYNSGYCMDGGTGGADGQDVTLQLCDASDINQQWEKIELGSGYFQLQKRGTNFSLDGGNNGAIDQNVYLWSTNSSYQNQHWLFETVTYSKNSTPTKSLLEVVDVYPNPFTNTFTLNVLEDAATKVAMYDANGKLVFEKTAKEGLNTFENSDLSNGLYFLKIETDTQLILKKMIKK